VVGAFDQKVLIATRIHVPLLVLSEQFPRNMAPAHERIAHRAKIADKAVEHRATSVRSIDGEHDVCFRRQHCALEPHFHYTANSLITSFITHSSFVALLWFGLQPFSIIPRREIKCSNKATNVIVERRPRDHSQPSQAYMRNCLVSRCMVTVTVRGIILNYYSRLSSVGL